MVEDAKQSGAAGARGRLVCRGTPAAGGIRPVFPRCGGERGASSAAGRS